MGPSVGQLWQPEEVPSQTLEIFAVSEDTLQMIAR